MSVAKLTRRMFSTKRALPTVVDHVVVGGGIAGCGAAVGLAQSAGKHASVLILEQNMISSGTTWHAAGLVTQVKGHEAMVEMAKSERRLWLAPNRIPWPSKGTRLAVEPDKWEELLRASHKLRHAGVPFTTYGPGGEKPLSEARALHPLLDFDASAGEGGLPVYGAMHTPTDGIVNPADACQMLVREARSEGVQFSERTRVVELLYDTLDDGCIRVTGVEVEKDGARHVVQCNHSILMACGQWTTPLAAMLPPGPA
eukprot:gene18410-27030_t